MVNLNQELKTADEKKGHYYLRIKFLVTDTIIIKLCSFNSSLGDANKGKFFTREKKK